MQEKIIIFCFILFSFWTNVLFAQKENNNWAFGDGGGTSCLIDFNSGIPVVTDSATNIYSGEGNGTISDSSGNLLFYTNGIDVWNKNHQIMTNGSGLLGNISTTQLLILKQPLSDSLYYIFHIGARPGTSPIILTYSVLRYTIVDVSLNGGVGDVIAGQKNIVISDSIAEKITAVRHANNSSFWILVHEIGNANYLSFQFDCSGVNSTPVISSTGTVLQYLEYAFQDVGQIKASKDNSKIACASFSESISMYGNYGTIDILDFDNQTGTLSNPTILSVYGAYGVEFSPNSNYLYYSLYDFTPITSNVFQYDLSTGISTNLYSYTYAGSPALAVGGMQLAPDGKIYIATQNYPYLQVINQPDIGGLACSFQDSAIYTGQNNVFSLPSATIGFYDIETMKVNSEYGICLGDSININGIFYSDTGKYIVAESCDSIELASISYGLQNKVENEYLICVGDSLLLYGTFFADSGKYLVKETCDSLVYAKINFKVHPVIDNIDSLQYCKEIFLPEITGKNLSGNQTYFTEKGGNGDEYLIGDKITKSQLIYAYDELNLCFSEIQLNLIIDDCLINIPNVFTPNGDGFNDFFVIENLVENWNLTIFNRWGKEVYQDIDYDNDWSAKGLHDGIYYYVLQSQLSEKADSYKGWVEIRR